MECDAARDNRNTAQEKAKTTATVIPYVKKTVKFVFFLTNLWRFIQEVHDAWNFGN